MTKQVIIVAMSLDNVIGINGKLPWHIPSDLERFKKQTRNHYLIMGRKTFDEILERRKGKPLSNNRVSVVITRSKRQADRIRESGSIAVASYEDALASIPANQERVFIIGGAEIYRRALPTADELRITYINMMLRGRGECTLFPEWNFSTWRRSRDESNYMLHGPDDSHETRTTWFSRIYLVPRR